MTAQQTRLVNNPIFAALPDQTRQELLGMAASRKLHRGQVLAHAGEVWPHMFMVVAGAIQAVKESSEGRSLVVTTFSAGDLFWGMAFFHEGMEMPATLRAEDVSEVLVWNQAQLVPILQQHGAAAWELSRLMVQKLTRASEILEEITFQPVAGRLAKLLLDSGGQAEGPVARSMTLDEMAARIGSTREMVCRFLHRFADEGMIDITRTEFNVTDKQRLQDMAGNVKGS